MNHSQHSKKHKNHESNDQQSHKAHSSAKNFLVDLPPEILKFVIEFLDGKDLCYLTQTCITFQSKSHSNAWWKTIFQKEFPFQEMSHDKDISWKDLYISQTYSYFRVIAKTTSESEPRGDIGYILDLNIGGKERQVAAGRVLEYTTEWWPKSGGLSST